MNIQKHIGKYGEKPCVVIFREVPNEPESCLIVQTRNLPEHYHDGLMMVVQSAEAQESNDVSQVLNRRQFSDGQNMLTTLHYGKYMQKVPVSMVVLNPTPSQNIALADLNAELRKINGGYTPPKNDEAHLTESVTPTTKSNEALVEGDNAAQGLLIQADLMEQDAKNMIAEAEAKRAQAYQLDPTLLPKKRSNRAKKDVA